MKEPSRLEMLHTRASIRESRIDYFEALASHHMRVGQLAFEMRKVIECRRFVEDAKQADEALEYMAKQIETSFAEAFGTQLIAADEAESK